MGRTQRIEICTLSIIYIYLFFIPIFSSSWRHVGGHCSWTVTVRVNSTTRYLLWTVPPVPCYIYITHIWTLTGHINSSARYPLQTTVPMLPPVSINSTTRYKPYIPVTVHTFFFFLFFLRFQSGFSCISAAWSWHPPRRLHQTAWLQPRACRIIRYIIYSTPIQSLLWCIIIIIPCMRTPSLWCTISVLLSCIT